MFKGVNMTMPADNLMLHSTAGSTSCLAIAVAPENVNSVVNVIASMQQQNHRVLIDVPNGRIGLAREFCPSRSVCLHYYSFLLLEGGGV
ncbi:hypothetical protein Bca52824_006011 [Brassica carinata]|uniref:Peptidase A1 domain-containing protein n=1 Tax=Brassica carinata TaxID=52824 RepID=A0A8X7WR88_BRACI|nr:hypothetical protein Bca52824_006011 [Brassica carinata]